MNRVVGIAGIMGVGVALALATACGSSTPNSGFGNSSGASGASGSGVPSSGGGFGGTSGASGSDAAAPDECKKMDIVFVVDNSGSMEEEQTNLGTNFPKFVEVISNYKTKSGDALDYRIAVTSSDDGKDKGKYHTTAGAGAPNSCSPGPARPWLERPDGDVAGFFSCRAQLGTDGSNIERPLENMLLSVTSGLASNSSSAGSFLRDDALLAFILITDEDEGSAGGKGDLGRPMAEYPGSFDDVKGARGRWAAAVIAGEQECESAFGSASEAPRLKGFINDVGKNGVFSSICTGDLTQGLTAALNTFDEACKNFPAGPVK